MALPRRRIFELAGACGALPAINASAWAQGSTWPNKPIRIIVPAGAGGVTDVRARRLGERLAPITRLGVRPQVLVVHKSVPAISVAGLLALARARPGELSFASPGNGTPGPLASSLLLHFTDTRATHVPYKGGGQAITDLAAGHLTWTIESRSSGNSTLRSPGFWRLLRHASGTRRPAPIRAATPLPLLPWPAPSTSRGAR